MYISKVRTAEQVHLHMRGSRRGDGGPDPPSEKSQKCRVSKQYWSGSPENISQHSKLGHHRPASETPFKWRFVGGPKMAHLKCYLDSPCPSFTKKPSELDPL